MIDKDEPNDDAIDDDIEYMTEKYKKFLNYWITNKLKKLTTVILEMEMLLSVPNVINPVI